MIRPVIANALLVSILFSVLAGGGMLLISERPVSGPGPTIRDCGIFESNSLNGLVLSLPAR